MTSDPGRQVKVIWGGWWWTRSWRRDAQRWEVWGGGGRKGGTRASLQWALTQSPQGWLCLRTCQSRGEASPRGHGPPGRWENNSSFCQSFEGQGSDGHHWELEPASGTHPVLHLNTGRIDTHTRDKEKNTSLASDINIHAKKPQYLVCPCVSRQYYWDGKGDQVKAFALKQTG